MYRLPNGDVLVAETNSPPREGGGITGCGDGLSDEQGRRGRALGQPHHLAARREWRWRGGKPIGVADRAQLAVRHGADGRLSLRRRHRPAAALPVHAGPDEDHRQARNGHQISRRRQSLGAQRHRRGGRQEPVSDDRIVEQHRRERDRRGSEPRRHPAGLSRHQERPRLCRGHAQPQRPGARTAHEQPVGGGQRARHARVGRPARLYERGRGRRQFRLAVVLLGRLSRPSREAGKSRRCSNM